jgi:hypothetical protein
MCAEEGCSLAVHTRNEKASSSGYCSLVKRHDGEEVVSYHDPHQRRVGAKCISSNSAPHSVGIVCRASFFPSPPPSHFLRCE